MYAECIARAPVRCHTDVNTNLGFTTIQPDIEEHIKGRVDFTGEALSSHGLVGRFLDVGDVVEYRLAKLGQRR